MTLRLGKLQSQVSATRLGDFRKYFATNFLPNLAKIFWQLFQLLKTAVSTVGKLAYLFIPTSGHIVPDVILVSAKSTLFAQIFREKVAISLKIQQLPSWVYWMVQIIMGLCRTNVLFLSFQTQFNQQLVPLSIIFYICSILPV